MSRDFVLGLRACRGSASATVVASRNGNNALRFAAELGVPTASADYEAALSASEVDALYIATPPSMHEAHALAGIAAGKPVLVEKPFALDAAAAARIVEAARLKKVFCMEGMWTRFLPLISAVHSRIVAGAIGEVRGFRGEFCGPSRPDPAVSNFDPARGGGALMHKGVYPVSLARLFLGPIESVESTVWIGDSGVDEECALALRHATGAISTVRASNRTAGSNDAMVYGTKGLIHIKSPICRPPVAQIMQFGENSRGAKTAEVSRLERWAGEGRGQGLRQRADYLIRAFRATSGKRITSYYTGNGFQYEAEALMQGVAAGTIESNLMPLEESIDVMKVVDKARAKWCRGSRT
ncbi:MAG: Gfo/Idh/MocA family oxidoreductase [Actinomycetia bacterium]|nr:Gfo/Idh/MocA family oxidoreductase [Actinomycetes bacterium]